VSVLTAVAAADALATVAEPPVDCVVVDGDGDGRVEVR
jgi:hypothetical protein